MQKLITILLLTVALTARAEIVADYRNDFLLSAVPAGWHYLWNKNGSVTNEANFVSLELDVSLTNEWQTDGTNPGRPDPGQGGHLRLTAAGVCPGLTAPDAYAVAGYTIQTAGRYFLKDSFLSIGATNSTGVELRVFINSRTPLRISSVTTTNRTVFDTDLGLLKPGDTVYVALGPGSNAVNDYCQWDFSIDRQPAWYSSGYPDPEEVPVRTVRPLSQLDLFKSGQPVCFSFRSDYLSGKGYSIFSNTISQSYGHAPKMFAEERELSADNQPLMAQYALDCPEKMLLCHYNFKEIKIMQQAEFAGFFPGHWLYYPGSVLTNNMSAADTTLNVQSTANFIYKNSTGTAISNSILALIPLDGSGARQWAQTEFVTIISQTNTVLTVGRGKFRTAAAAHPAGTVVAVLGTLYEGDADTYFRFNWSADCPLDSQGRNCGDVFVAMIAGCFKTNQPLERIHGILTDVLYWNLGDPVAAADVTKRRYDADGNGLGDNGYDANGVNRFALGVYDMVRKLRTALGSGRILCSDGNGPDWPRLPHLFNGMESEGLSHWNDPFAADWSSNPNNFRYWNAHKTFPQPLSYIVDKIPTLSEVELDTHKLHLQRLAGAVAAILDIRVTANGTDLVFPERRYELYDHLKQGVVNRSGWLGAPSAWMRPAANSPNLFSGSAGDWISTNATVTVDTNEAAWRVRTTGDLFGPSSTNMTIQLPGFSIPDGDLFFRFQMKAAPLIWFPSNVYRYVTVTVDGRQVNTNTADTLTGTASSDGYSECCFYYRKAGPAAVNINLAFEGPQDVWIKDFSVHNATDVLVRGFENGVVLANPENETHTFNIKELFPDRICWRITGNSWEDPAANSGGPVGDTVDVPALDGLFLRSEPDVDGDGLSDRWELLYAADLTVLSGHLDSDSDGISDADENAAGTDPLDENSRLRIGLLPMNGKMAALSWTGVMDRSYSVSWSTNLSTWTFYTNELVRSLSSGVTIPIPSNTPALTPRGFFKITPRQL
jgi:hypothetical protein